MKLYHLQKILRFYARFYFILMLITPIYALGSLGILYFYKVNPDDLGRVIGSVLNLLISTGAYFLWWKIFFYLADLLVIQSMEANTQKNYWRICTKLFFFVFITDILDKQIRFMNIGNSANYTIENLTTPRIDATTVEYMFYWFQQILKSIGNYGNFLTPTTFGISNLLIASIFYLFTTRNTKFY